MKKVFVLGLAVIFGFSLIVGCAHADTTKSGPKKKWIKMRIDFESGEVLDVKAHDPGPIKEKQLTQEELDELLQGEYTYIGKLLYTKSSPGCVTYILGGYAFMICW
jgi:hypothetical protein